MNILMIAPEFPPNFRGGLGKQVGELVEALSENHTVGMVAPNLTENSPGTLHWNTSEAELALPSAGLDPLSRLNMAMISTIYQALNTHQWDVIHAHDWVIAPAITSVSIGLDIPILTTFHANNAGLLGGSEADRTRRLDWEKTIVSHSTAISGVSAWLAETLQQGYPEANVKHIPNGLQFGPPLDRALNDDVEEFTVTFVGRLVPQKGVADLIRAWSIVVNEYPDARLNIIGDGFQQAELVALSDSLGLSSSVSFLGWCSHDEIQQHLASTSIAVFPSHEEAFGLAAAEAIGAGVPVLLSDIPAYRELVPHDFAGFFDSGNPTHLAAKISSYRPDFPELETLAIAIKDRYGWDRVIQIYKCCYDDLHTTS